MIEMVRRFVRQKYGSAGLVVALVVLGLLEVLTFLARGGAGPWTVATWGVLILAAGSVSRDVSSGALQMILARPIRRTQYLFGRYLGILASYGIFLAAVGLVTLFLVQISARHRAAGFDFGRFAGTFVDAFLGGALQAAILLFFSTFLPGIADILGFLILQLLLNLPFTRDPAVREALERARENLAPELDGEGIANGSALGAASTGRWILALTIYLAAAALVFSRRELPYGQD